MSAAETASLRAIEGAITGPHEPAQRAPEVDALIQAANVVSGLVNERDGLRHENAIQRQRIAILEKEIEDRAAEFESNFAQYRASAETEIARLRTQGEEAADHAKFFMQDADRLRDAMNSCERIIERTKGVDRGDFADRAQHRKAVGDVPATAEPFGAPRPQFLKGAPGAAPNVTSITRIRPVSV